ncbi:MAG TPA: tetratricopeptide repeat protein [Tepidisphaeraceae bacterium]|nr:tetratricopeptide repeat protein [Tepidisphaeraceae bacterium]
MGPTPEFIQQMQRGQSFWMSGRFEEAAKSFLRASEINPQDLMARANYAISLAKSDQVERALPVLQEIAPKMNSPELYFNLGNVYRMLLRLDEAIAAYDKALSIKPDFASAHWNRGLTLLLAERFLEGWKEYEWRFRLAGRKSMPFVGPAWNGSMESLAGKTLMIGSEQGFGDAIQFARYIPIVAKHAARVVLVCQPELRILMKSVPGLSHVMSPGDSIPKYDTHAALMSMGRLLGTTIDSIPADVPYLTADPMKRQAWRERLDQMGKTKKIGIVWGGRPTNANERHRAIDLAEFQPLVDVPGVTLISLQKGPPAEQIKTLSWKDRLVDWTSQIIDFSDTAALLAELDLLITVETAVAHLGGALAKPVWTLIPSFPDWRWLRDRSDSPWYSTMKLFRQSERGQWGPVIQKVANSLVELKASGSN